MFEELDLKIDGAEGKAGYVTYFTCYCTKLTHIRDCETSCSLYCRNQSAE